MGWSVSSLKYIFYKHVASGLDTLLLHVVRILAQNYKAFEDGRQRYVLVRRQLGALAMGKKNGRGVGLEACDCLRLTGLTNDIDGLEQDG